MMASLRAELRKIFTIRSTYLIILFAVALLIFFAFYTEGMKAGNGSRDLADPNKLAGLVTDAVSNLVFFGSIIGILSLTHEYRYNTITYALTAARSRTQVLLTKIAAVSMFAIGFTVFVSLIAVAFMYAGLAVKGYSLVHQSVPFDLIWRVIFLGWATSMMGLLLAALIRQQVGTLATYFVFPGLGELLLGLLLKDNRIYLPFTALTQVLMPANNAEGSGFNRVLSPSRAALVVSIYLVAGWLVAWYLFLRRDAN